MAGPNVVVFLGSRWASLERQATRWREILLCWTRSGAVGSLTVVDWPSWSRGQLLSGRLAEVQEVASWLPGVRALDVRLSGGRRPTPLDALAWRATAKALTPSFAEADLALSTNPLWNPVLPLLGCDRRGFDAVDDWREHPVAQRVGDRIDAGYRGATGVGTVTANSHRLAQRLAADYSLPAIAVPNGVDLDAFEGGDMPAPDGLPSERFAVYVGVVQERVDLSLLEAVAGGTDLRVVVAGPASPADAERLERSGVTMLGLVHHDLVPGLLMRAAVGLIPHHVNEFTTSMDPMKLLEYLAAGLPVVTTPLPGVEALSPRVFVAAGAADFVAEVRHAAALDRLEGPDPAVAGRNWQSVADRLLEVHLDAAR